MRFCPGRGAGAPRSPIVVAAAAPTQPQQQHEPQQQQRPKKIIIAGAGIGGLVFAVAALKRGFEVQASDLL